MDTNDQPPHRPAIQAGELELFRGHRRDTRQPLLFMRFHSSSDDRAVGISSDQAAALGLQLLTEAQVLAQAEAAWKARRN